MRLARIQVGNTVVNLNDWLSAVLNAEDGLWSYNVKRFSERGTNMDGDIDTGFVIEPRFFTLKWFVPGQSDCAETWRQFARLFTPSQRPIKFFFAENNTNAPLRVVDVVRSGEITYIRRPNDMVYAVTFKFADGVSLYSDIAETISYLGSGSATNCYPFCLPFSINSGYVETELPITYSGDWLCRRLKIKITGQIRSPKIYHKEAGWYIGFSDLFVAEWQTVEIDIKTGVIKNGIGKTVLPDLRSDTNLFALLPENWEVNGDYIAGGINTIGISGIDITANTKIDFIFNNEYMTP